LPFKRNPQRYIVESSNDAAVQAVASDATVVGLCTLNQVDT
jgi:methylmalonyl-CoA mutase cobalamin-binding subunit